MSRLTAEEARQLADAHDPSKAIDAILANVRKAAARGEYMIKVSDFHFGSNVCYCPENQWPPLCQAIVKELRALGFQCDSRSECRQFVDLWLEVSWGAGK